MSRFAVGVLAASLGAMLWGFSGTCAQYLFSHYEISTLFITTVRMLLAGAMFLVVILARKSDRESLRRLLRMPVAVVRIGLFGVVGLWLCQVAYLLAITYTNAGTTTVIQTLNVVFVLVVVCLAARRLPRPMELAGIVLALVATVLICTKGDLSTLRLPIAGLLWGLLDAACVAFYCIYPKRLIDEWGTFVVTGIGMLVGAAASLLTLFAAGAIFGATDGAYGLEAAIPALDLAGVVVLLAIVVLGTFTSFTLYLYGISVVGSVKGSLLGSLEPVSASVFAVLWMGTMFTWADWVGLVLMVATVFLVSLRK